jgi:hypothetical protein
VISGQPQGGAFVPGSTVTLNVAAGGSLPLAYQWKKNGGNISGATSSILTLPSVALSDSGDYQVVVANSLGSTPSVIATVSVAVTPTLRIQMNPGIVIEGTPGAHYRVEYSTAVAPTTWLLLEDIPSLPMSPWVIYDPTPTDSAGKRFYRAVLAP